MDDHPAAVSRQQTGQLQYLVLGLLGGVGGRDKVDHLQLHAAAGHHPGGNGGVQAAGQQADGVAAHTHRQAAGTGQGGSVDVGGLLPNLHIDRQIGLVNVHGDVGKCLGQIAAHRLGDLNGVQIELLVRPLALHLEAPGGGELVRQIPLGGFHNGLHRFFAGNGPGHRHYAEHLPAGGVGRLHVAVVRGGFHINGALADIDLEAAAAFQPPPDVVHQLVLKGTPVQALQDHLAQLQQKHFVVVDHE